MTIGCVVLAAGEGRRFGGPKQLAKLGGRPLLEHALAAANASPVDRVAVVLGANADLVLERVDLKRAQVVICQHWRRGMAESLKTGIDHLGDVSAAVVILGDQPLITAEAIGRVLEARGGGRLAVRATYSGIPGHPVLLERALFPQIKDLRGDAGARELLASVDALEVPCDGMGRPLDVDTPEDLRAARP